MEFFLDILNDSATPVAAGGYGPDGLAGFLPGQGISQPGEVDLIAMELVGQVDYAATALGGTLPDPFLVIWDSNFQVVDYGDNSFALGPDPLLQFRAPFTGTYFVGVTDITGGTGDYTLTVSPAGPPVFFGGFP
jgi:hypothetical protein